MRRRNKGRCPAGEQIIQGIILERMEEKSGVPRVTTKKTPSNSTVRTGYFARLWPTVLSVLLVVATVAVYFPVHAYQFLNYDDDVVVTNNVHVKYGLSWDGVKWAFTTFYFANWQPLAWVSHALDSELFGLKPGPHHDTNLLLHALNAVLLFWVLLRATGYTGRSFMVAALFALHPINVESVAWVAERRNPLSMLFFLLGLGAYRWYARDPKLGRYIVVALLFVLGLMSKPQIITFPFVLLLWDYWPLRRMFASEEGRSAETAVIPTRGFSWLVVEKLPLFGLAAASAVVTMKAQAAGGGINRTVLLSLRLENAVVSYARYLGKAFWPTQLANLYPLPMNSLKLWQVLAAGVLVLAVTALVVAARRHRYLPVGWLWFLGTLVPMIGLVQLGRHAMADRYAYLPFIGLFIMVCWRVADLHLPKVWEVGLGCAVLLTLALVAHHQLGYWRDSVTLWSHTLQVTSGNFQAEDNLASALMEQGHYEKALRHLQAAEAIYPLYPLTVLHAGLCEQQLGNLPAAIEQYKRVLDLTDSDILHFMKVRYDAFQNMAVAYRDLGDIAHAMENAEAAQALRRNYVW